jgi:hypothetical protein
MIFAEAHEKATAFLQKLFRVLAILHQIYTRFPA